MKFQGQKDFTFHSQKLTCRVGSVWNLKVSFEPWSYYFFIFSCDIQACTSQDLVSSFKYVFQLTIFINQKDSKMERLHPEIQSTGDFDQPSNKDLSHLKVDIGLKVHVVLFDDWIGFIALDVSHNISSVASNFVAEIFGLGEGILNLNFVFIILNFLVSLNFGSFWLPPQRNRLLNFVG